MGSPGNNPEKAPKATEELKRLPTAYAKCLGCRNGYVWDEVRNRRLKCTACDGKGSIKR